MEEKNDLKFEYPFRIIDLKTNFFSAQNLSDEEIENFNPDHIEFGIKPGIGFNEDLNAVKINFIVTYDYQEQELLKIDVDTVFEFRTEAKKDMENSTILAMLLGISFSTIRGIILNRTIGSFMNNIYLPIINPSEIIKGEFQDEEPKKKTTGKKKKAD